MIPFGSLQLMLKGRLHDDDWTAKVAVFLFTLQWENKKARKGGVLPSAYQIALLQFQINLVFFGWGAAGLRWWRPHVWRLCPRRTQRWLAFHSALNSPERREKIKSEISSVQVWQDLFYDFISWSHLWKEKTIIVPSLSTVFHNTWLEACI